MDERQAIAAHSEVASAMCPSDATDRSNELENRMKALISVVAVTFLNAGLGTACAADLQENQREVMEKQRELTDARHLQSLERSREANQVMQQISRVSKIIGTDVKNSKAENLGDVKELVLNPESGQVVYAVVSFGGVLGMGDKLFAVPWTALHWARDKEYYVLDVDKNTLKKAPGFDKKHWPDSSSKWEQQREELNQFYHVNP
jgi:sporulation protein YlmC with PRC-barrel domain